MQIVDHNHLFWAQELDTLFRAMQQKIISEIDGFGENYLLNTSTEDLVNYIEEKYHFEVPSLQEDETYFDQEDRKITRKDQIFGGTGTFDGNRISFFVPFTGDPSLFHVTPSTRTFNPPYGSRSNNELKFVYDVVAGENAESIRQEFDQNLQKIRQYLQWVREDVEKEFNRNLRNWAKERIEQRRNKFLSDKNLVAGLGFPMKKRENMPRTYAAPEVKRKITPTLPPAITTPFQPEPTLDMEHYEHILSVISNMATVLECSPEAFKDMGEEDLRTHFLVQLNGHYTGGATGETFNKSGKTDILIRVNGKNIFIAECKFWKGPDQFTKTIDQLLGYLSWRDTKAALLIFNRKTQLSTVLEKIPPTVKGHPNYKRELDCPTETSFRYVFHHSEDKNREIIVTVMVFEVSEQVN